MRTDELQCNPASGYQPLKPGPESRNLGNLARASGARRQTYLELAVQARQPTLRACSAPASKAKGS